MKIEIEVDEQRWFRDDLYGQVGSGWSLGRAVKAAAGEGLSPSDLFTMGIAAWLEQPNYVRLYAPDLYGDEVPVLRSQPLLDEGYSHEDIYQAGVDALFRSRASS